MLLQVMQTLCFRLFSHAAVRLDLKVVDDSLVKKYLMKRIFMLQIIRRRSTRALPGTGKAKEAQPLRNLEISQRMHKILKNAITMEVYELADEIKAIV